MTTAFAPTPRFGKPLRTTSYTAQNVAHTTTHPSSSHPVRLLDNKLQGEGFEREYQAQNALPVIEAEVVSSSSTTTSDAQMEARNPSYNPTPILFQWLQTLWLSANDDLNGGNTMDMKSKAAFQVAATAVMAMALTLAPLPSNAAMSGGRMGGSFSSSPRMSRPAPSYGGGGGYGGGARTTYYSRPSVTVMPSMGYGYNPMYAPTPFYGGGVGVGAMSYARGPSFFDLIFFGGFLLVLVNFLSSATSSIASSSSPLSTFSDLGSSALGSGTAVLQVSVAMEVPNREDPNSILGALRRLSRTAKTDSRVGIQNLTSQVAVELLRRKSSIVSASSSYQHFRDRNKAEREYQSKSIQERSKFEKESISKYGGVDYSSSNGDRGVGDGTKATMAVVTLVLAIDGDSTKIPTSMNSMSDVEEALRRIASDSKVDSCLQSAEILWTPEDATETLTLRDVVADYPELRSL
jgi:uncharacterized membrane protein